jgi:hypothetical protein
VGSSGHVAWCAAYVFTAVRVSGKRLPGSGWAGVATWVRSAHARRNGLSVIPASEAKPGDLVAYDWDGGSDFGVQAHIGVLESRVRHGAFKTVEGNTNGGTSARRDRTTHTARNTVFIRVSP